MENITLGQIASAIGLVSVIAGLIISIVKLYKTNITDKINKLEQRLTLAEMKIVDCGKETEKSKVERMILLRGELACLKGLKEMGCNDAVTHSISEIEKYMIEKSHD